MQPWAARVHQSTFSKPPLPGQPTALPPPAAESEHHFQVQVLRLITRLFPAGPLLERLLTRLRRKGKDLKGPQSSKLDSVVPTAGGRGVAGRWFYMMVGSCKIRSSGRSYAHPGLLWPFGRSTRTGPASPTFLRSFSFWKDCHLCCTERLCFVQSALDPGRVTFSRCLLALSQGWSYTGVLGSHFLTGPSGLYH